MTHNPVRWFEIYVQDMARAKAFYESVFRVKLEQLNMESSGLEIWSFPMKQNSWGAAGALVKMDGVQSGGGGTLVYFGCEDCAVEVARVLESGGGIDRDKFSIGEYGFIALMHDTEGNMIGLHSTK